MKPLIAGVLLVWAVAGPGWPQAVESAAPPARPAAETSPAAATGSQPAAVQRFDAADLGGKLAIINGLAAQPAPADGPLVEHAINYLVANLALLKADPQAEQLGLAAARLVSVVDYTAAAGSLWQLFQFADSSSVRRAILASLGRVARGNAEVVNKMNHWLAGQNLLQLSGSQVDPQTVDACVRALGALRDASSFFVIFSTMNAGYGQPVAKDALDALRVLGGNRGRQLLQVVEAGRPADQSAAFDMAINDKELTPGDEGRIAAAALKAALSAGRAGGSAGGLSAVRFRSVRELARLRWTPAVDLVLENFNRAAAAYARGTLGSKELIDSADALAAMGTHEAAVRLSLYLDLINSMTAKGRPFDESVTLAIIQGLGGLGDPVAYGNLLAVQYLGYPDSIKAAARRAVSELEE